MEGFLHHMAPQFLHPALQNFGCSAFRPLSGAGAFHPLYPTSKAFARHFGEQYALGQTMGQALRVREDTMTPPLYRHSGYAAAAAAAMVAAVRDDTSSPGSATSASPRPCKDEDGSAGTSQTPCSERHHEFINSDGERKSNCGVCGTRLSPGVAQAHFLQELQHLYSLSALPRESATHHHQDEDARWETYQRIRSNRQRRLRMRTRKRHHTVESMLGYDLVDDPNDRPNREPPRPIYDAEDEPVDVEGDSIGWPETVISTHTQVSPPEKESQQSMDCEKVYPEDLEISSTNDNVQSPELVRIATPKNFQETQTNGTTPKKFIISQEVADRPAECVSTSESWATRSETWPSIPPDAHIQQRQRKPEENLPSSTDPRN